MSSFNSLYIKKETLQTLLDVVTKKNEKGIGLTISINDDTNQWGQNIYAYVSQTEEQREAQKKRFYVGNGKTFWTNGVIKVAEKKEQANNEPSTNQEEDGLPF